ncbi:MAG: transposase [Bacteroidales bacterium]
MRSKYTKKESIKQTRVFSLEIKKQVVRDIESGRCTIRQASRELLVSEQSVYRWIGQYSRYLHRNKRLVVEDKSEAYRTMEMEKRIQELEAALGRKQMEIDLLSKVIDLANEEYHTDLKKSLLKKASSGSGSIKASNTATK